MRDPATRSTPMRGEEVNTERKDTYYWRNREKILARLRRRYRDDEEYRQMVREKARRRYHEDEAYREATKRRSRERYWKMKEAQSFVEALRSQGTASFRALDEDKLMESDRPEPEPGSKVRHPMRGPATAPRAWPDRQESKSG